MAWILGLAFGLALFAYSAWICTLRPLTGVLGFQAVLLLVFFAILPVTAIAGLIQAIWRQLRRWPKFYRMTTFADANNLTYQQVVENPDWDGFVFNIVLPKREALDVFRSTSGNIFEYGNFHYKDEPGKNGKAFYWGYIAIPLAGHRPPMVLRATKRFKKRIWVLRHPAGTKPLSLGPGTDKHFKLYAAPGYETEAEALFSPTLVAQLRKLGPIIDVGIYDDNLYVFHPKYFKLNRPEVVKEIFATIAIVTGR